MVRLVPGRNASECVQSRSTAQISRRGLDADSDVSRRRRRREWRVGNKHREAVGRKYRVKGSISSPRRRYLALGPRTREIGLPGPINWNWHLGGERVRCGRCWEGGWACGWRGEGRNRDKVERRERNEEKERDGNDIWRRRQTAQAKVQYRPFANRLSDVTLPLAVLINNRQSDRVRNHLIASTNFVACSCYFYLFFIVLSTFLRVEWVHFLSTLLAAAWLPSL